MHTGPSPSHAGRPARRAFGFTLIELMIVVGVIGILSLIALPAYLDSVRKSRRAEAVAALSTVQQAQERWRANCPSYTTNLTAAASAANPCAGGLGLSGTSSEGRYAISISAAATSGYAVAASAVAGKGQTSDRSQGVSCASMSLTASGGAWSATPPQCWSR